MQGIILWGFFLLPHPSHHTVSTTLVLARGGLAMPPLSMARQAVHLEIHQVRTSRRLLQLQSCFTALAESNLCIDSHPPTPRSLANPGTLTALQPSQPDARLGLLTERTLDDPRDLQSSLIEQDNRNAVLYEMGIPAMTYRLPLARLTAVCQVYSHDYPNFWLRILDRR